MIGAFADIFEDSRANGKGNETDRTHPTIEGIIATSVEPIKSSTSSAPPPVPISASALGQQSTSSPMVPSRTVFHNRLVKQKTMYQSNFRFQGWLKKEKAVVLNEEQKSIRYIETRLSPVKGQRASVIDYVEEYERVEERLSDFYDGSDNRYTKYRLDMERVRHADHQLTANR